MKMRDVFKLPMLCESGDGYLYSDDLRYAIVFDDTDANCYEQKKLVAHAINNHDKLVGILREVVDDMRGVSTVCQCKLHCKCSELRLNRYESLLAELEEN